MISQFCPVELELALWVGSPLNNGVEINSQGYSRAFFGEPQVAIFGSIWGVVNRNAIEFLKAEEPWEVTHCAIMARHYDVLLNCCQIGDVVAFADPVTSTLDATELKTVPEGHSIVLAPASIFLAGNIVVEMFDLSGQSKMIH